MTPPLDRRQQAIAAAIALYLLVGEEKGNSQPGHKHDVALVAASSVDWRSLTFTGRRHHLVFAVPGGGAAAAARLADATLDLPRGVVVIDSATWSAATGRLAVEAIAIDLPAAPRAQPARTGRWSPVEPALPA